MGIMLWRKQQFTSGWNFFWWKRKCHWRTEIRTASNKQNWRKHCKNSSNCARNRWLTVRSIAEQVNIDRGTVRKILTEDLDMRKVCAKMVPKELTKEQEQRRVSIWQNLLERQDDIVGHVINRWWNMGLPIQPWNEAAKCTMKDCQFPTTKKILLVQIRSQNNVDEFFWY